MPFRPPVGGGVRHAEPGDLRRGSRPVQPHGELLTVGERHVGHRVRVEVAETVIPAETEFVRGQQGVDPDQRVPGRAAVDGVPGEQEFLGGRAAAGNVPRVEDQALVSGLGQVAGGDQAVVPGSGNDDIGVRAHAGNSTG